MFARALIVALALSSAACAPDASERAEVADACAATASMPWRPLSGIEFLTSASTTGDDCGTAEATIVIADASGATLYSETYPVDRVMVLAGMASREQMGAALAAWIDQSDAMIKTSADLPDWPADAPQPTSGEFPFYPEENIDRDRYLAARASGGPVFCYVQGMESLGCVIWGDGVITKLGAQSFPG